MHSQGSHASFDYLFTRLHGLWAHSVNDVLLERMLQSNTLEDLQYHLKSLGIDCSSREAMHASLVARNAGRLSLICRSLAVQDAAFYYASASKIYYADLAALCRRRYFPNENDAEEYIFSKRMFYPTFEAERLLACRGDEEFAEQVPLYGAVTREHLTRFIQKIHQVNNSLLIATEMQRLYFKALLQAAGNMSSSMSSEAMKLAKEEIDIVNLSMLMRSLNSYHLSLESLQELWISGDSRIELGRLAPHIYNNDLAGLFHGLPEPYRHLLEPLQGSDLYLCENALWNHLYHASLHLFHAFDTPQKSVVAYPYLNQIEIKNIVRIYEAVRLGMPARELREMLIS